jgi:hypothetical protein
VARYTKKEEVKAGDTLIFDNRLKMFSDDFPQIMQSASVIGIDDEGDLMTIEVNFKQEKYIVRLPWYIPE